MVKYYYCGYQENDSTICSPDDDECHSRCYNVIFCGIVNDHFADILWMNGEKLQARYYWKYVLNLEEVEDDLKDETVDPSSEVLSGASQD